ncbi:hypothetical protein CR513_34324, partial [Mucuna pruriens]
MEKSIPTHVIPLHHSLTFHTSSSPPFQGMLALKHLQNRIKPQLQFDLKMVGNHEDLRNYGEDPPERMLHYFIVAIGVTDNICCPLVGTNNFEPKPSLINMMQNLANSKD